MNLIYVLPSLRSLALFTRKHCLSAGVPQALDPSCLSWNRHIRFEA